MKGDGDKKRKRSLTPQTTNFPSTSGDAPKKRPATIALPEYDQDIEDFYSAQISPDDLQVPEKKREYKLFSGKIKIICFRHFHLVKNDFSFL